MKLGPERAQYCWRGRHVPVGTSLSWCYLMVPTFTQTNFFDKQVFVRKVTKFQFFTKDAASITNKILCSENRKFSGI